MSKGKSGSTHPMADAVRERRLDGMSFSAIGDELGMTRSAVAGLCRRLGLCEHTPRPVRQKKFKAAGVIMQVVPEPKVEEVVPEVEETLPEEVIETPQNGVSLFDLKQNSCRWIIEEGRYCGVPKTVGAYCADHAKLSYVPSKPRKLSAADVYKQQMRFTA